MPQDGMTVVFRPNQAVLLSEKFRLYVGGVLTAELRYEEIVRVPIPAGQHIVYATVRPWCSSQKTAVNLRADGTQMITISVSRSSAWLNSIVLFGLILDLAIASRYGYFSWMPFVLMPSLIWSGYYLTVGRKDLLKIQVV